MNTDEKAIKKKLQFLYGEKTAEKTLEKLNKLIPNGQIVHVPGWIHPFGWMLAPDEACIAILEFLSKIRTSKI